MPILLKTNLSIGTEIAMNSNIKVAIITNVPAPYRVPVWRRVAAASGINLELIFCSQPHIDTSQNPADYGFSMHFLTGRYIAMKRRFMHCDFRVWALLDRLQPDVVITTGYIPTFLFGFLWALVHGIPHIAMTDGTANSEKSLTRLHRWIRRAVFGRSAAFVGACEGSRNLFKQFGVPEQRIHLSYLCADNLKFTEPAAATVVDFIFCGRFVEHKRPLFALQVAKEVAIALGRKTSLDFVGSGDMEQKLRTYANEIAEFVDCRFLGYATQAELPGRYAGAKIFLFPSEWDPWGVVANEACASGLPVIVSPNAGVATELVVNDFNGYVCELNSQLWADAAVTLLRDAELYKRFSQNSRQRVAIYNFDNSAQGLVDAIKQAYASRNILDAIYVPAD